MLIENLVWAYENNPYFIIESLLSDCKPASAVIYCSNRPNRKLILVLDILIIPHKAYGNNVIQAITRKENPNKSIG